MRYFGHSYRSVNGRAECIIDIFIHIRFGDGRASVQRAPRGGFELDRGLSFVRGSPAYANNRGAGIEKAPHAAGERAVDAALHHGKRNRAFLLGQAFKQTSRAGVPKQPI